MESSITRRSVLRISKERLRVVDDVTVESPLEIRCQGEPLATLMRTPGHDIELVRGLCFAEGVLRTAEELRAIAPSDPALLKLREKGHVVEINLSLDWVRERWPARSLFATSACGVCGLTVMDSISQRVAPVAGTLQVEADLIRGLPRTLRGAQENFARTGGLHAAGLFDPRGNLLAIREDVGRHNAVDKVVGVGLESNIDFSNTILGVSGRTGYEIIQKAAAAGIPLVASVSAPSSLAIDMAERFRITLCGFVRDSSLNVYSHASRLLTTPDLAPESSTQTN